MSIKIEGGNGEAENVIKSGASNELLYNDKEVLLKENLGLDLSFLPDLTKAQEFRIEREFKDAEMIKNLSFTVPEDGWIVKVYFPDHHGIYFIEIDGFGEVGMTPSQDYKGFFYDDSTASAITIECLNCPYPVKKGQVISVNTTSSIPTIVATVTFAPCKGL